MGEGQHSGYPPPEGTGPSLIELVGHGGSSPTEQPEDTARDAVEDLGLPSSGWRRGWLFTGVAVVAIVAAALVVLFVVIDDSAKTYAETSGGETHTHQDYADAGGTAGPEIAPSQTVRISCRITGFKVKDGDTWWYRIASAPWSGHFYAPADAFYNNGATAGSLHGTPFYDRKVRLC